MKKKTAKIPLIVFLGLFCTTLHAQTVMKKLASNSQTSQFAEALSKADLGKRLNSQGPYTVFAPSNDAFSHLSATRKNNHGLLLNHIMTGMASKRSLRLMTNITTLGGEDVHVEKDNQQNTTIDGYKIVGTIRANNGIIQIINGVIK